MTSLSLGLIGNGSIGALIDARGAVAWCCFPRFDGDPVFCSLLSGDSPGGASPGVFTIELEGVHRIEQHYIDDTPILVTRLIDAKRGGVEITDFCPRFEAGDELFCPRLLVRQVRPIGGKPRIVARLDPSADYGCAKRPHALGGGHVSYAGDQALRLTTNAPTEAIVGGEAFHVDRTITMIFGLDDQRVSMPGLPKVQIAFDEVTSSGATMLERTIAYWRGWTRPLRAPGEWRDAVIRAAITLELNVYEPTGAIIASITTSIPEAPDSGRTWDYRYCWPRDAFFTADALCRLGHSRTVERYLAFLLGVAAANDGAHLVPIYAVDGKSIPDERIAQCLPGYRGMGPVHVGNKASEQAQHDLYGEAVLTAESLFLNSRDAWDGPKDLDPRNRPGAEPRIGRSRKLLARLEAFGEHAARLFEVPDAGLWELRGAERVHTFSSMMCWAACDRLAKYSAVLKLADREEYWRSRATRIHEVISRRSWNVKLNAFTATMDGDTLDASLLLMPRLGFIEANDPRFLGTVAAIESQLKHGDFIYRYVERDDFGVPENAFLVCTFWYIEALAAIGGTRREEARRLFKKVLSARNQHGLLAEDLDPRTLEQWGNFPQTYCMAGIIDCALALSTTASV
ncbi:MAG: glycoside hydrolase family 15 protein [Gemmatimonadaceae bacterium]